MLTALDTLRDPNLQSPKKRQYNLKQDCWSSLSTEVLSYKIIIINFPEVRRPEPPPRLACQIGKFTCYEF